MRLAVGEPGQGLPRPRVAELQEIARAQDPPAAVGERLQPKIAFSPGIWPVGSSLGGDDARSSSAMPRFRADA